MLKIEQFLVRLSKKRSHSRAQIRSIVKFWEYVLSHFETPAEFFNWLECQTIDIPKVFTVEYENKILPQLHEEQNDKFMCLVAFKKTLNDHFSYKYLMRNVKVVVNDTKYSVSLIHHGRTSHVRYSRLLASTYSRYTLLLEAIFNRWFSGCALESRTQSVIKYKLRQYKHQRISRGEVEDLDILRPFGFKGDFTEAPSAEKHKRQVLSSIASNAKRVAAKETKHKVKRPWQKIKEFVELKYPFFMSDPVEEQKLFSREMRHAFRILDLKEFDDFGRALEDCPKHQDAMVFLNYLRDRFYEKFMCRKA